MWSGYCKQDYRARPKDSTGLLSAVTGRRKRAFDLGPVQHPPHHLHFQGRCLQFALQALFFFMDRQFQLFFEPAHLLLSPIELQGY